MIDCEFDKTSGILRVRPESSLDKNDFAEPAKAIDPEIAAISLSTWYRISSRQR
jgi:hypothetical protein